MTDRGRRRHPRLRGDQGAATTELVLVTPALLFIIMLLVQFGLWMHATHVARSAAQEGARAARVEGVADRTQAGMDAAGKLLDRVAPTLITNRQVTSDLSNPSDPSGACVAADPSDPAATSVCVEVEGDVVSLVPFATLSVDAVSEGPIERFTSDAGP
ncbi:MAG: TadE family protein [Acidimicrobiales bacterium]